MLPPRLTPRLRAALDLIGTGVLVVAPGPAAEFLVLAANRRAAALLRLPGDAAPQTVPDALPGAIGRRLLEGLRDCSAAGRPVELEASSGDPVAPQWLRMVLVPASAAERPPKRIFVTVSDVTGRKRAEAESLAADLRFRNLAEESIQGLLVLRDDRALFCNPAFVDLFGFRRAADVYRLPSVSALILEPERGALLEAAAELALGRTSSRRRLLRATRRDGEPIWIDTALGVALWDDLPALQVALHDVTARIRAERALWRREGQHPPLPAHAPRRALA